MCSLKLSPTSILFALIARALSGNKRGKYSYCQSSSGDSLSLLFIAKQTENMKVDQTHVYVYLTVQVLLSVYSVFDDGHKEPKPICVMFTFVNAANNTRLQDKLRTSASSLLRHASVPLDIYIIGDKASKELGEHIIKQSSSNVTRPYKVHATRKQAKCEHYTTY